LLDTNVVIHLVRGNALGQRIDERYGLRQRPDRPFLSVVTVGEARSLARYWNWGVAKTADLEALLRELVLVDVSHHSVLERYAEMHSFLVRSGRRLGDNDVWITA
jgi:predicted nucleic acid-binding protein